MDELYLRCIAALVAVYGGTRFEAVKTVQRLKSEGRTNEWIYAEVTAGRIKPDAIEVASQAIDS
jgi:hypothetical protein